MVTHNPLPVQSAAPRGAVQKTFVPARVLSGFTDANHFEIIAGEYLATLPPADKASLLASVDASRAFVAALPPLPPSSIVIRDIIHPHVDALRADPLFSQAFGRLPFRFAFVNPADLLALQGTIEPRSDTIPSTLDELLEFALPRTWDIPAELSFIQPAGPIQILSSNPGMQGIAMELDNATGKVMLSAPKHLNLVQVVNFAGRLFLRNGYHRVADAIAAGVTEFPAIVIDASSPDDVALQGASMFRLGYVLNLPRPPLVSDYHTAAAVRTQVRERRYGMIVSFDIKPINIGI